MSPVPPADTAPGHDIQPASPSAAQARIIVAALELFARHGVGGTSLQMIADEVGVTKAAVYHQYKTKDEIILAAAEAELARLDAVIASAKSQPSPEGARASLIEGIVDLAVSRRHTVGSILSDPVIIGFFADHDEYRRIMRDLRRILLGDEAGPEAQLRIAMLTAAISGAVTQPQVRDIGDDLLRSELVGLARRFVGLPG